MPGDFLSRLAPARLTESLRRGSALEAGAVIAVRDAGAAAGRGVISEVARLRLTYSPGATGELPQRLFAKASRADLHTELHGLCAHEVELYQAADGLGGLPIPRCYAAEHDPETGETLLLTEDLTETHSQRPLPLPPSDRDCELLIDALADLHGLFWQDPRLGRGLGRRMLPNSLGSRPTAY